MWRGFFSLYGVVFAALALSFLLIFLPLNWYIQDRIHKQVNHTASGIYFLLEQKLGGEPRADTKGVIDELNQLFPYGVEIVGDSDVEGYGLGRCAKKHLKEGKIAYHGVPYEFLLKRLGDSGEILKLNWEPTSEYDNDKIGSGVFKLIEQHLSGFPRLEWRAQLLDLAKNFEFPLEVYEGNELKLSPEIREVVNQGHLATHYLDQKNYVIYGRISESDLVVKAGPFNDEIRINKLKEASIPFVLTAFAILFWMHSLWRDIKKMNETTKRFGHGELAARVNLGKRSALASPAEQFNQMAGDIEKLIEGSRELTNAVSHDIKTPLARMRFALEMMEKDPSPEVQQRFVASLEGDIAELEGLVEEVMANARYERQLSLSPEPINDFFDWIKSILERKEQDDPELQVEYLNKMPAEDQVVSADKKAMARAIGNVFRNGLHYAAKRVRVTVSIEKNRCVVLIEDDGPGIPATDRDRVVQPFVRLDASRKKNGHGLGLAIAHRIVQQHGGELEISESVLQGAAVRLMWPAP